MDQNRTSSEGQRNKINQEPQDVLGVRRGERKGGGGWFASR